ncbi:MAG: hypothetical protein RI973_7 [Bacteroidota bacterium]|jgi:hypothetical protein
MKPHLNLANKTDKKTGCGNSIQKGTIKQSQRKKNLEEMPAISVRGGQEEAEIYRRWREVALTHPCLTIILIFLIHFQIPGMVLGQA